jgi:NitT/TauT family transport system substrate-binding protein
MRFHRKFAARLACAALCMLASSLPALGEPTNLTVAKEYGIGYLPYMVMEHNKLIEKHASALGVKNLEVAWRTFGGSGLMQGAMLAGRLDFASSGVPWFLTMWDKLSGQVKSPGALDSMPQYLNTRNPEVKSLKDFSDKDRIAVPAVKSSVQAITLQMGAAAAFGADNASKLDPLTVSLSHPDAMTALLSGISEIDTHFSSPPFQDLELKDSRVHKVLSSYDLTGGQTTFIIAWTTTKFYEENPKTYQAFTEALSEAQDLINKRPEEAARIYLEMAADKRLTQEALLAILRNPDYRYTIVPQNVMKYADFMFKTGSMKTKPASWKELFFPNVYDASGS